MSAVGEAKVRPLLLREGARYACFGDGLCCTDMHALGPLTRSEVVQLRSHAVERNEHLRAVLGAAPFPSLDDVTWTDVAHHFRSRLDGTGCSVALAWFGDRILEVRRPGDDELRRPGDDELRRPGDDELRVSRPRALRD